VNLDDVLAQLSERGRLEWEMAVLRAENAALAAQMAADSPSQQPDSGSGTEEA